MSERAPALEMTPAEYLAFERASTEKHEYVDGLVFLVSEGPPPRNPEGQARRHSLAAASTLSELHAALFATPCEVYGPDMKVTGTGGRAYSADVSVVSGRPLFEDATRDVLLNPKVIVEVLSSSTERYDRVDKFAAYRTIGTLEDYVLVSQTEVLVEHYHRHPEGGWMYRVLGPGQELSLESLGCAISVDRIYHKVFQAESESA